jgi:hypothetical protein
MKSHSLNQNNMMARLRDFAWWPSTWMCESGSCPAPSVEDKNGVLKNVRTQPGGLTLMVDQNGVIYTARIVTDLSEEFLILLRHILLQHWGEPMDVVENIEIDFDIFRN